MTYSFDSWGWLAQGEIPGRTTSIEPPQHGDKIVGQPYPNFISPEQGWAMPNYSEPPIPDPKPAERAALQSQLDEIDAQTNKPRTLREVQLGVPATLAWLEQQNVQAGILRAQLRALG